MISFDWKEFYFFDISFNNVVCWAKRIGQTDPRPKDKSFNNLKWKAMTKEKCKKEREKKMKKIHCKFSEFYRNPSYCFFTSIILLATVPSFLPPLHLFSVIMTLLLILGWVGLGLRAPDCNDPLRRRGRNTSTGAQTF